MGQDHWYSYSWTFKNKTIQNLTFKMFGNQMNSNFECSVFELPLYIIPLQVKQVGGSKFNWKKKIHMHLYCTYCQRICLSVVNFDPNYLRTGWKERTAKKFGQDYLIFHLTRTKTIPKKICNFGCQSIFISLFLLQK